MIHRRAFLFGAAASGAAFGATTDGRRESPRIEALEVFVVRVNHRGNWVLIRIRASNGLTGVGDASHGGPDVEQVKFLRETFALIQGRSIHDVEYLHQATRESLESHPKLTATAVSGIEQALWDLQGKTAGVPVYDLLGGALRHEIRVYANINRTVTERTPEGFAAVAQRAVEDGFDAVKLAPFDGMPPIGSPGADLDRFTDVGIACAEAVRKVLGDGRDLLIDVHSHMDRERGLRLAERFAPLRLFWLEEVTPAKPSGDLAAINEVAGMPTAGGESIYGVKGFYPYVANRAVDIVMPDVKFCGGLLEMKKIAGIAEGAGLLVSPHGPASPVGGIAAAHLCATLPNFLILEHAYGEVPWRAGIVNPPERISKSRLRLSDAPGFGVEWNDAELERHKV